MAGLREREVQAATHIQAWKKVRSWEGGGSFCLDGKLSENPELRFQFRPAYWFCSLFKMLSLFIKSICICFHLGFGR